MVDNIVFDLSVCLPVWYGAKVNEVENILDSFYSALEVIDKQYLNLKIKFLIGIDNVPKNYVSTFQKPNHTEEIIERINVFKNAISNLNKNIGFEFFITEYNEKVSVMRSIMISKSQDSEYLVFLDHDDRIKLDGFNTLLKYISRYNNTEVNFIYFKTLNLAKFVDIGFACWSVLYRCKALLEKQICFISGIPLEDRLFRRELELFSIKEEQLNSEDEFYLHSKEQGSGWLNKDTFDIVEQEFFKRAYYRTIKPKIYSNIKIGTDELFFLNNAVDVKFCDDNKTNNELFFKVNYSDKFLKKEDLKDFRFMSGYDLFKYPQKNQFLLCKVKTDKKEEIFCKGYLTNGAINIDNALFDKFNKLVDELGMESSKLIHYLKYLPKGQTLEEFLKLREDDILKSINTNNLILFKEILDNDKNIDLSFINNKLNDDFAKLIKEYVFKQAFDAVIREDIDLLKKLLKQYPDIVDLKDSRGINLANIACRRQTIKSLFQNNIKNLFIVDKDKIIILLFTQSPNSFEILDNFNVNGFKLLFEEYTDNLKTKINFSTEKTNEFIKVIFDLIKLFENKEETYQLVDYFRIIYKNISIIKKLIDDKKTITEILKELKNLKEDYFLNEFIVENLIEAIENKNYEQVKHILLTKDYTSYQTMGVERRNVLELVFAKYTPFESLISNLNKREKNILFYIENDKNIKKIIEEFLTETIFIHFSEKFNKDVFNPIVVARMKEAFLLLFNEKYNFNHEEIRFNDFYNAFIKKSQILESTKVILESNKSNLVNKNKFYKRQLNEINSKEKFKNINKDINNNNKFAEIILESEKIQNSKKTNYQKILNFLDLLNNFFLQKPKE